MTYEDARILLTTEPATKAQKLKIIKELGYLVAEDQPCPICGKRHSVDFVKKYTTVHPDTKEIHTVCTSCNSFTVLKIRNLFTANDPSEVIGIRQAWNLDEALRKLRNPA